MWSRTSTSAWPGRSEPSRAATSGPRPSSAASQVRTDLDRFSQAEQAVLENHGYVVAGCAVQRRAAELISANPRPFVLPNPDWLDEAKVRRAMADSHRQQLPLGRR